MTEVLHDQGDQGEQRNPRPIGRFLLGMEDYVSERDPYEYAREYAFRPGNFQKHKHKSLKVESAQSVTVDGRAVELEFSVEKYAYVWKIIVAAERHKTEYINTNYIPHGGERYELHCARPKPYLEYYERGVQGNVISERNTDSAADLQMLQGLIERILTEPDQ